MFSWVLIHPFLQLGGTETQGDQVACPRSHTGRVSGWDGTESQGLLANHPSQVTVQDSL